MQTGLLRSLRIFKRHQHSKHMGPIATLIETKIQAALEPVQLDIVDESYKHAGHAAMKGITAQETHFNVKIVSDKFAGKSLLQRHKWVYSILDEEMKKGIHALCLSTKTTQE